MPTAYNSGNKNQVNTGGTSIACSVTVPAGGGLIVVGVAWASATVTLSSITDGTNTYTLLDNPITSSPFRAGIGYAEGVPAGTYSVTANFSADPGSIETIAVHVVTGCATSSALDAHNATTVTVGAGTDNITVGLTLGSTGDYLFGQAISVNQNTPLPTAGTGFGLRQSLSTFNLGVTEDAENYASSGSKNVTFNANVFDTYIIHAAAFKPAPSTANLGSPPGTPPGGAVFQPIIVGFAA